MDRRRFVKLVAMGGAAAIAAPLSAAGAAAPPSAAKSRVALRREPAPPAIQKELANQEHSLAVTLKTIRNYELPPGSPMAFVFTPLRSRRKGR